MRFSIGEPKFFLKRLRVLVKENPLFPHLEVSGMVQGNTYFSPSSRFPCHVNFELPFFVEGDWSVVGEYGNSEDFFEFAGGVGFCVAGH
ncbi:hypothetical protein C5D55_10735 [Rathayibacter toxicus]|nr:hypothetical protein C5D55_10735 [Rathayibacter toxicus]